jgi:two-component system OmpR family response regulator
LILAAENRPKAINDKTILVVDDEPKIVEVVCSYLEKNGYRTITAHSGEEALERFKTHQPDLVVLDLMLGVITGEEVCNQIRRISSVPVIMLTAKADEESMVAGLASGADDYVTKPFSPRQLIARINAVLRRVSQNQPLTGKMTFAQGLVIDPVAHTVSLKDQIINLTPSEYKLLDLMARHPGRCFSRADLVEFALGYDFDGLDRAIDSHIKNLRQKIESDPKRPLYIQTVFGVGYRFGGGSACD